MGAYRHEGVITTVFQADDGGTRIRYESVDDMKDLGAGVVTAATAS